MPRRVPWAPIEERLRIVPVFEGEARRRGSSARVVRYRPRIFWVGGVGQRRMGDCFALALGVWDGGGEGED